MKPATYGSCDTFWNNTPLHEKRALTQSRDCEGAEAVNPAPSRSRLWVNLQSRKFALPGGVEDQDHQAGHQHEEDCVGQRNPDGRELPGQ